MFNKWSNNLEDEETNPSVKGYIHACIKGYPRGGKPTPSLLNTRVKGILSHSQLNGITYSDEDINEAKALIDKYRAKIKEAK
jgi:hypothetical protein